MSWVLLHCGDKQKEKGGFWGKSIFFISSAGIQYEVPLEVITPVPLRLSAESASKKLDGGTDVDFRGCEGASFAADCFSNSDLNVWVLQTLGLSSSPGQYICEQ